MPLATLSGPTMGTRFTVRAAAPPSLTEKLQVAVDRVDAQMSTWKADSVLSRFNSRAPGTWFDLPEEMAVVIRIGLEAGEVTEGAFDMTLGALVDLWGFGPAGRAALPSDGAIAEALGQVGHRHLAMRGDDISKATGLHLDLSGIAKGFGVDELARVLLADGIGDFVAEIDGELRVSGRRPDGSDWRVAIALPVPGLKAAHSVICPGTMAVATSGDYRHFFTSAGNTYSHTIDPRTGHPIGEGLASATVLDPCCARADAIASALMVMGPDKARDWCDAHNVPAVLMRRIGNEIDAQVAGGSGLVLLS